MTATRSLLEDPALVPRDSRTSHLAPRASHGEVHVVSRVVGFKKIKFYTNENVGSGELDLPEQQMHTSSYWLTIPADVMAALPYGGDDRRDGVVGLAFAMRHVAQLLLMCDGHDVGMSIDGGSLDRTTRTGGKGQVPESAGDLSRTVFIYDNYPGRHSFQPAAVRHARRARAHARADHDLSRARAAVVRRAGRKHGPRAKQVASRFGAARRR
jgi:hypothetical protein